ncbi:DUF3221 domain-containing protein [Pontibacter vulgaris]|uniref:DUF3221 domain-containing protein n=1 Tax=Pontibacter vulgaris TaxID=2905679 RepID=UPI001FA72C2C|nr:DUF3221 domain-containing protein [Pontibacter vulgaris]
MKINYRLKFIPVLFSLFILGGCGAEEPDKLPDTTPDIRGSITTFKKAAAKKDNSITMVLVEAADTDSTKFRKANLRIDNTTLIQNQKGDNMRLGQLQQGQQIEAWLEGPVMESDPVQAHAAALRILD